MTSGDRHSVYFGLEFTPGGLVDVGVPHLLIGIQLLLRPEDTLQGIWDSSVHAEKLGIWEDRVVWLSVEKIAEIEPHYITHSFLSTLIACSVDTVQDSR